MSDFDAAALLRFLQERWGGRACPVCGKGPWQANDRIFQLTEFNQGNLVLGGPIVPVIPVTCSNCGNTVLVNAIIARALKPPDAASKPEEKPTTGEGGQTK